MSAIDVGVIIFSRQAIFVDETFENAGQKPAIIGWIFFSNFLAIIVTGFASRLMPSVLKLQRKRPATLIQLKIGYKLGVYTWIKTTANIFS